jgi:hypothetical protein
MAKVTAAQWLDKWSRRLNAAGPDITAGVDRVQTAPGVTAAAAADRMLAGVTAAIQNGTWQNNVSKVTLQQWKDSMKNKALNRISAGTQAAVANKQGNVAAMLSAVDAAVAATNAIPRGSLEQNIQRSVTFQREMAARAPKRQK